jgi:predicted transcriptional regulator
MTTRTAPPTVDELQRQITKLQRQNDDLVDAKLELEGRVDELQEQLRDAQEADEGRTERTRQIVVDHHDDTGHRGSQRFCTEAPCPALNALIEDGGL